MKILLYLYIIAITVSCRLRQDSSDLRITNPLPALGAYPEVVKLDAVSWTKKLYTCTGTFVTPRIILTAAHCLHDPDGQVLAELSYTTANGEKHVAKMYPAKDYKPQGSLTDNLGRDLAMLDFGQDIAPKVATLAKKVPQVDDAVTFVGFGRTNVRLKNGAGTKNMGQNNIIKVDGSISTTIGHSQELASESLPGFNSVPANGDSGGAMFNSRGELAGVISTGGTINYRDESGIQMAKSRIINVSHPTSVHRISAIVGDICNQAPINP